MTKIIYKDSSFISEQDFEVENSPNLSIFQIRLKKPISERYLNKLDSLIAKELSSLPISTFSDQEIVINSIDGIDGCSDLTLSFQDTVSIEIFLTGTTEMKNKTISFFQMIQKATNNSYFFFLRNDSFNNNTGFFIEKNGLFPTITDFDTWIKPSYNKLKKYIPVDSFIDNDSNLIVDTINQVHSGLISVRGESPPSNWNLF